MIWFYQIQILNILISRLLTNTNVEFIRSLQPNQIRISNTFVLPNLAKYNYYWIYWLTENEYSNIFVLYWFPLKAQLGVPHLDIQVEIDWYFNWGKKNGVNALSKWTKKPICGFILHVGTNHIQPGLSVFEKFTIEILRDLQ